MIKSTSNAPPFAALEILTEALREDSRIKAAWLEGSFGRNEEDRYSDIDLHILSGEISSILLYSSELLTKVSQPVLIKELFSGKLVYSLLENGVRVDIVLHTEVPSPGCRRILVDRGAGISDVGTESPSVRADELREKLMEFWRCIAMLPVVLGRGETIVAVQALVIEVTAAAEILALGYNGTRTSGMKRLNKYLPGGASERLEAVLALKDLSVETLAGAHLNIAKFVSCEGRVLAENLGFDYPTEIETTALSYVTEELSLLGVDTVSYNGQSST